MFWLTSGAKNTRFFHNSTSTRNKTNAISQLKDDNGQWCTWNHGLQQLIVNNFSTIFTSKSSTNEPMLKAVEKKVKEEHNKYLLRPFETHEVKDSFSMHLDKSPSPNCMNPTFFKLIGTWWVKRSLQLAACT